MMQIFSKVGYIIHIIAFHGVGNYFLHLNMLAHNNKSTLLYISSKKIIFF